MVGSANLIVAESAYPVGANFNRVADPSLKETIIKNANTLHKKRNGLCFIRSSLNDLAGLRTVSLFKIKRRPGKWLPLVVGTNRLCIIRLTVAVIFRQADIVTDTGIEPGPSS